MDDEAKIEAAAKAFFLGLFSGVSAIRVERQKLGEAGGNADVWMISLVTVPLTSEPEP